MARQLLLALGGNVQLVSGLRSHLRDPHDIDHASAIAQVAASEVARISAEWQGGSVPAVWFCYHPYYKAPDLIGPELCARFGVAYVTAECSVSARRDIGLWADAQARVRAGVALAAVNICLTRRDQAGLQDSCPGARTAMLAPFIDPSPFLRHDPLPEPGRLICVAMMRPGDKAESYAFLAAALQLLTDLPWRLSIIGDGEARSEVQALFAPLADRITWLGAMTTESIAAHLAHASVYVWPGCGEAYGLAYLEAQSAGLPVVAQRIAGVPEVVKEGVGGLLTAPGDIAAYAHAIRQMLNDVDLRVTLARKARGQVLRHHSVAAASATLATLLAPILESAS
ncbi:MAG: glycosyltransferase family 4 protein [Gemmobacter sp.]|nr:glycosyltransferase family 4 protein [Gemmobacter sp.]